jgi:hypothetical protein
LFEFPYAFRTAIYALVFIPTYPKIGSVYIIIWVKTVGCRLQH